MLGRVVDGGLDDGVSSTLLAGCAALLGVGLVQAAANVVGHRLDVENWLRAAFTSSQLIGRHVTRTGDAVTAELPTGEVVATVASDALRMGEVFAIAARFLGGVAAYATIAVLLMRTSVALGVLVLVGLPVVVGILSLLVKPLQGRQSAQREASGRLTTLGADTVSGLRILRGIGGEEVFAGRYAEQSQTVRRTGVRVAQTQSLLDALQTLLPGLFLAAVVWYGARLALAGEITPDSSSRSTGSRPSSPSRCGPRPRRYG
ncbi:ABC transporter transmembrane domain-containing protein [Cellulomonas sp. ATA003]|uniref:ABC transporter transmembrane domain-containing protein n=1 Tax=Cellulomonas sp. ATA003 TaxID=3073064 RepID=UPI00287337C9|nr:ABC transporter transmembrane domain-containing protein [Cellulomonas sp. ATA003]WNB86059.1 ABC transporter transmembrane domain-containing protein [Cellulomonas sp. ATA003]